MATGGIEVSRPTMREIARARYNPADVDAVLDEIDRMVIASERDAFASPGQMIAQRDPMKR